MDLSLTNPGLSEDQGVGANPATGMPMMLPPIVKFFKNAALRGHQAALDEMSQVHPNTSNVDGTIAQPGATQTEDVTQNSAPTGMVPKFFKPSFTQATTDSQGLPAQINPSETKLGKLVHILAAAAHGAQAGWGTMNAAAGADRAREIPIQMAQQRQGLEAGQLENQQRRAALSFLPTQFAMQRATLQNTLQQTQLRMAQEEYYRQRAMKAENTSPEDEYNTKLMLAQKYNLDPEDTKAFVFGIKPQKDSTAKPTEFEQFQQNPDAVMKFWDAREKSKNRNQRPTSDQFRLSLYQRDPEAFSAIYGSAKDEVQLKNNMLRYRKELSDQLEQGTLDPDQEPAVQQTIRDLDGQLATAFHKGATGTTTASTAPGAGQQFKMKQSLGGHDYGRNSVSEPWKRIN